MLRIKNLNIYLEKDLRQLIKDFDLIVNSGDKVAFIGDEGNGKSTVLKLIKDKKTFSEYITFTGDIEIQNEVVEYLPQQLSNSELNISTAQYFNDNVNIENLDYKQMYSLIDSFSIQDYMYDDNKLLKDLSGGERIKYLILCKLLNNPTLLLLDEPSNDLDIDAIEWLEKFIQTSKLTIIFVSHDKRILENCATMIVHFEQIMRKSVPKITVSKGNYTDYINNRERSITQQNKRAKKEESIFNAKLERFYKVYNSVNHAQNQAVRDPVTSKNLKDKMHVIKSLEKRLDKEKSELTQKVDTEKIVTIKFLESETIKNKYLLNFQREQISFFENILLQNVQFDIIAGDKIAIIGQNGSGKTTLLREILRDLDEHKINYKYMPQNYLEYLNEDDFVLDYLLNTGDSDEKSFARTILGSLNFTKEEMFRQIKHLSGGQKAKLFLAKFMLEEINFLVLDEPTRNLSIKSIEELEEALQLFNGTILFISHDKNFIETVATKIYKIENKNLKLVN